MDKRWHPQPKQSPFKCPIDNGPLSWNRWSELVCPNCTVRYYIEYAITGQQSADAEWIVKQIKQ